MRCFSLFTSINRMRAMLVAASVFFAAPVFAECTQDDLTGVWWFTGTSGSVFTGFLSETVYCRLRLGPEGGVVSMNSECSVRNASGEQGVGLNGGRFSLNSSCWITGRFNFCNQQFCDSMVIDEARLSAGKDTITLMGVFSGQPGSVIQLNGVKK